MASHKDDLHNDLEELVNVRANIDLIDRIAEGRDRSDLPISLHDIGDAWQLEVEIPGVRQGDVQVGIEDNHLVISGVKPHVSPDEEVSMLKNERAFGPFERQIALPGKVRQEEIRALLGSGVLTVIMPKR